jgi:hypothetical protein
MTAKKYSPNQGTQRGAPNKEQKIKNKLARMEDTYNDAKLTCDQSDIDNYKKYRALLQSVALGTFKGASATNQISTLKVLVERCEDMYEVEEAKASNGDVEEQVESTADVVSLISLSAPA